MIFFSLLNVSQVRRDTLLCGLSHLRARQSQKYEKHTAVLFKIKKKPKRFENIFFIVLALNDETPATQPITFSTRLRIYLPFFYSSQKIKNKRQKCVSNGVRAGCVHIFAYRHRGTSKRTDDMPNDKSKEQNSKCNNS